jgi:hypothetical protein
MVVIVALTKGALLAIAFNLILFQYVSLLANPSVNKVDSFKVKDNEVSQVNLVQLAVPSFRQDAPVKSNYQLSPIQLELLKSEPNNITDDQQWLTANNLSLPIYQVPNSNLDESGNLPDYIPTQFKQNILVKAIHYPKQDLLIYGENYGDGKYLLIYDNNKNKFIYSYDFSNYSLASSYEESEKPYINQSLTWAIREDEILYVSHSHNTYAKSSHGMNGYLTAINTYNNEIVWRSQPLVCNSSNFVIIDDVIICGYGFTAESDFLYMLDKYTGEILQQIKLKTAPNYIIRQQNKLYVRSYDTNYVFAIKK